MKRSVGNVLFIVKLMFSAAPTAFSGLGACRLTIALAPIASLAVFKQIVDVITVAPVDIGRLHYLIVLEFAIVAASTIASRTMSFLDALCAERFTQSVSLKIMQHAMSVDQACYERPTFYDGLEKARLQATDRFVMIKALGDMFQQTILVFSLSIGAAAFSLWYVVILFVCTLPIFFIDSRFALRWYTLRSQQTEERRRLDYFRYLATSRDASKEIRLFQLKSFLLGRYSDLSSRLYGAVLALQKRKLRAEMSILASTAAYYGIYAAVVMEAAAGVITLGAMLFLVGAFSGISRALQESLVAATSITDQANFVEDLRKFFQTAPERSQPGLTHRTGKSMSAGLQFHGVSFAYPDSTRPILDSVSFRIAPGESVALVGENGEGKTTIVKLILRFYDPTEGFITFNGKDIREYALDDLHASIGAVFQDFMKYEMSMRDNILLTEGDPRGADSLDNALHWSRAADLLDKLPDGLEQQLGRRFANGVDLSGGEWQRLALARAYLRDWQMLILDEPSAALDAKAERDVFERLKDLSAGRMSLLISHRFSTVRSLSRILVISHGAIVEEGSHDELMRHEGKYHSLYTIQAASFA